MRNKITVAITAAFVLSLAAFAYAQVVNTYTVTGSTSPTNAGSKKKPVPVSVKFGYEVGEASGNRPSPVKKYSIKFAGLNVNTAPFPKCSAATLQNGEAGRWTVASVTRWTGGTIISRDAFRVFRAAKLTGNATPEPVTAGKRLVVRGKLSRANWDKRKYAAYAKHKVQLQFRTSDGRYATVATVTSSRKGAVKKAVRATVDGCYRFVFAGNSTTRTVTSVADCVNVR